MKHWTIRWRIYRELRRHARHEPDINYHFCADPFEAIAAAKRIDPTVVTVTATMSLGVAATAAGANGEYC